MVHILYSENQEKEISVEKSQVNTCGISISSTDNPEEIMSIYLTPNQLSDLIGVLLHEQSKLKRSSNE